MPRRILALLTVLALPFLFLPLAIAHPAPPPPEPFNKNDRQLHDCNDDWGGHAIVNDGHDLIAADVTERYNATLGDDLFVVYLTMNGGYASTNSQHPTLKEQLKVVGGRTVVAEIVTTDNEHYTVTGADWLRQPRQVYKEDGTEDGSRFAIEVGFKYATLGSNLGQVVKVSRVDGYAGANKADYMAGGYYLAGTHFSNCPLNGTAEEAYFIGSGYKLAGTAQRYFTATLDTSPIVEEPNGNVSKEIAFTSKLKNLKQTININVALPMGWAVHVDVFDLDKEQIKKVPIHFLPGTTPQSGTAIIKIVSNEGGFQQFAVPLQVQTPPTTETPSSSVANTSKADGKVPGLELTSLLLALFLLLLRRRR